MSPPPRPVQGAMHPTGRPPAGSVPEGSERGQARGTVAFRGDATLLRSPIMASDAAFRVGFVASAPPAETSCALHDRPRPRGEGSAGSAPPPAPPLEGMANGTRYKDLLDYTVSYKAVWTTLGFVVAMGVAGWLAWDQFRPPGEDERARQDVKAAVRLEERAETCLTPETPQGLQDGLADGRAVLNEARTAHEAGRHVEASGLAREASDLFKEFIDRACATSDAVARFVLIEGDVQVKKAQALRYVRATLHTTLVTGDRIKTGEGVAQISYLLNDELQEVREDTIIEIKSHEVLANGKARTETHMPFGQVRMESTVDSGSTIETAHGTVAPAGDTIEVESPEGATETLFRSGSGGARVTRDGQSRTLGAQQRVISGESGLGRPRDDLPGPELVTPIEGRVFTHDDPETASTVFEWRTISGARHYVFQLGRNEHFLPVLNSGDQEVRVREVQVPALPPGQYFWRVAAVDEEGVRGRFGEERRFTVRGAGAPEVQRPPPSLSITSHVGIGGQVIVQGQADPYVTLECHMNGEKFSDVDVSESGAFQAIVPLAREGDNEICFVAQDAYGTQARACFVEAFRLH